MIAQTTSYITSPVAVSKACGNCSQTSASAPASSTVNNFSIPFWVYIIIVLLFILLVLLYLHKEKEGK